ncbi:MAG: acetamidase/formamidase family protein, partial [Burkholderiales bacterium]
VNGAEPGDTLKVRINKIVPRAFGYNINLPGIAGQFPKEFAQGRIRYLYIDLDRRVIEYLPGVYVPLAPFPGLIGVARKTPGPYTTRPPGEYGGNMDIRDLTEGATIHFPVWVPGGLLWSGDSHAAQGNGEVNVSAVETAFRELNLTIEVVKGTKLEYPRAENRTSWITMGFDPDLDRALDRAIDETAKLLVETRKLPLDQARALVPTIADCRVSQVVNGTKGVHCFTPKYPGAREDMARPTTETAQHYVSYSATDSVTKSMDAASLAMIDFIATSKKMPRVESYGLASIAMDCRVGAARAVHCLLPKRLWNLPK